MSLFQEHQGGKNSFRRVVAAIVIGYALAFVAIDTFTEHEVNETIWLSLFGGGVSIILSTMVKNRFNHHNSNRNNSDNQNMRGSRRSEIPPGEEDN